MGSRGPNDPFLKDLSRNFVDHARFASYKNFYGYNIDLLNSGKTNFDTYKADLQGFIDSKVYEIKNDEADTGLKSSCISYIKDYITSPSCSELGSYADVLAKRNRSVLRHGGGSRIRSVGSVGSVGRGCGDGHAKRFKLGPSIHEENKLRASTHEDDRLSGAHRLLGFSSSLFASGGEAQQSKAGNYNHRDVSSGLEPWELGVSWQQGDVIF